MQLALPGRMWCTSGQELCFLRPGVPSLWPLLQWCKGQHLFTAHTMAKQMKVKTTYAFSLCKFKRKCPHDSSAFFCKSECSHISPNTAREAGKRKSLVAMYSAKIWGSIIKGKKKGGGGGENGCWYTASCFYHTCERKKKPMKYYQW